MNQEDTEVGGTGLKLSLKCNASMYKPILPISVNVKTQAKGAKAREKTAGKGI